MDIAYEWEEETKTVDPAVYRAAAAAGIVTCLAWGTRIPKKWAKPDGTVFGGVKVDEWDGLCVSSLLSLLVRLLRPRLTLSRPARSHDLILIDELHRNGSLGVGQGLFGGLQIGASSSPLSRKASPPSSRALLGVAPPCPPRAITSLTRPTSCTQAARRSTTLARRSSRTASCPTSCRARSASAWPSPSPRPARTSRTSRPRPSCRTTASTTSSTAPRSGSPSASLFFLGPLSSPRRYH